MHCEGSRFVKMCFSETLIFLLGLNFVIKYKKFREFLISDKGIFFKFGKVFVGIKFADREPVDL